MKNLYDCHAHLDSSKYEGNRKNIINSLKKELEFIINIGVDEKSSEQSISYSYQYDFIYASVGIHPTSINNYNEKLENRLKNMADEPKVIAIGEIGLDYHWMKDPKRIQKNIFKKQMEIAKQKNLPVIIHNRDANEDTLKILKEYKDEVKGVMHTYAGDIEMMEELVDMGYYFSYSGPVTFKGTRSDFTRKVVKNTPIERILIETDSPYLSPEPMRGKLNIPSNVKYVAEKIAELKNLTLEEALKIFYNNSKKIFNI